MLRRILGDHCAEEDLWCAMLRKVYGAAVLGRILRCRNVHKTSEGPQC